MMTVLKNHS